MSKFFKSFILGIVVVSFFVGCGGAKPAPAKKGSVATKNVHGKTVYISSRATYSNNVPPNIKAECSIDTQLMTWIQRYAAKRNINVIIDGKPKANDLVLKVRITDAISAGHAGIGHNKYVVISGKLYKGKKLKASFKAARRSGGGYFGMYRSSCSVLGSCVKTLGKDTAYWLENPTNNARLGDTYLIR